MFYRTEIGDPFHDDLHKILPERELVVEGDELMLLHDSLETAAYFRFDTQTHGRVLLHHQARDILDKMAYQILKIHK